MSTLSISVLVLTGVLALHLLEEIRTGFRKKFPLGEMPLTFFVIVNICVYAYALLTAYLCATHVEAGILMAWIFAVLMLGNALLHIGIMAVKRVYFPGGYSAFVVLAAAVNLAYQLGRT